MEGIPLLYICTREAPISFSSIGSHSLNRASPSFWSTMDNPLARLPGGLKACWGGSAAKLSEWLTDYTTVHSVHQDFERHVLSVQYHAPLFLSSDRAAFTRPCLAAHHAPTHDLLIASKALPHLTYPQGPSAASDPWAIHHSSRPRSLST
jgi:hypothetical protein